MSAGKGSKPRPVDREGWEKSKLWDNIKAKAKNERIYNEGKDKLDGTGIEIIEEKGE